MVDVFMGILICASIAALVVSLLLAPNLWTPRQQWFKRSMLSGASFGVACFSFLLFLAFPGNLPPDYERVWDSLRSVLFIAIGMGLVIGLLSYMSTIILARYSKFLRGIGKKPEDASKKRGR